MQHLRTVQNCDEPVDCTESVIIVTDWEWECCWWWWHWVTMIMIMMSQAMYCKSVISTNITLSETDLW